MTDADPVVIVAGARTPIGRYGGGLSSVGAIDLGAHALRTAIARAHIEPTMVERVNRKSVV